MADSLYEDIIELMGDKKQAVVARHATGDTMLLRVSRYMEGGPADGVFLEIAEERASGDRVVGVWRISLDDAITHEALRNLFDVLDTVSLLGRRLGWAVVNPEAW